MPQTPSFALGPLLRHVDKVSATVFVDVDDACRVSITEPRDGGSRPLGQATTFHIRGHHFALIIIEGLEPGSVTPYDVRLDADVVWPLPDSGD